MFLPLGEAAHAHQRRSCRSELTVWLQPITLDNALPLLDSFDHIEPFCGFCFIIRNLIGDIGHFFTGRLEV